MEKIEASTAEEQPNEEDEEDMVVSNDPTVTLTFDDFLIFLDHYVQEGDVIEGILTDAEQKIIDIEDGFCKVDALANYLKGVNWLGGDQATMLQYLENLKEE